MSWWDKDWSDKCCIFFKVNTFACSLVIVSSLVFIVFWLISSSFNLLVCLTCRMIHFLMHFNIMFCWSLNSFNILMISFNCSQVHWQSCFLFFMFHEVLTCSTSAEALLSSMKTHLLTMLLSRRIDHDLTDLKLHIIVRKIRINKLIWWK